MPPQLAASTALSERLLPRVPHIRMRLAQVRRSSTCDLGLPLAPLSWRGATRLSNSGERAGKRALLSVGYKISGKINTALRACARAG